MISWFHFQLFHDSLEFFAIVFGIGTEHWQVAKKSYVVDVFDLVWIHAGQTADSVEIVVTTPIHITVATRAHYAGVCLFKLVIGVCSRAAATFGYEFTGSHG